MDLGAGRRGVDMGPSAIRYAGLERDLRAMGLEVTDYHNIAVPGPESGDVGDPQARYERLIEQACVLLRECVARLRGGGYFPLVLGGDHSIAMGTVAGLLDARERTSACCGSTRTATSTRPESSPSGNVHGMPVATMLGLGGLGARLGWTERALDPRRVVLFGTRTLDAGERRTIRELRRAHVHDERDRPARAQSRVWTRRSSACAGRGGIHISFDIDAVDPLEAPGVGTPWPGGLTYREAHLAMEVLAATGEVSSMEVVEVNPIADHENRTGKLAAELILSALGRTIGG